MLTIGPREVKRRNWGHTDVLWQRWLLSVCPLTHTLQYSPTLCIPRPGSLVSGSHRVLFVSKDTSGSNTRQIPFNPHHFLKSVFYVGLLNFYFMKKNVRILLPQKNNKMKIWSGKQCDTRDSVPFSLSHLFLEEKCSWNRTQNFKISPNSRAKLIQFTGKFYQMFLKRINTHVYSLLQKM